MIFVWVSPECIAKAKEMDLLTYLEQYEPNNLVRINGNTYSTKEHDSLKISNGIWHWFSRHIGGRSALDYLIKVKEIPFTEAVTILSEDVKEMPYTLRKQYAEEKAFEFPKVEDGIPVVSRYLQKRGIHPSVIDYCQQNKILYEDSKYHNCVFVGKDESGTPKFGCVRSTATDFKMDLPGSDKQYSFCIPAKEPSKRLRVFEAAIDLLSFASLAEKYGYDWHSDHLLSLSGVYLSDRDGDYKMPIALEKYLKRHSEIEAICFHLDNDYVGREATRQICNLLKDQYALYDMPPKSGKDYNDYLQNELKKDHRKEMVR